MKKLALIILLFSYGCHHSTTKQRTLTKQQRAEAAVKMDILSNNPKENINNIKFTRLDNNTIGVIEDKWIYDRDSRPVFIRTVYYSLNDDLTKVIGAFTD